MLISYNWLQKYFKEPLPTVSDLADTLTMGIFEIDAVNEVSVKNSDGEDVKDFVFDVKVLPDRAPYCLSHRYIAKEISALLQMEYVVPEIIDFDEDYSIRGVSVTVGDTSICPRYSARRINNISVKESPAWLKNTLEVLGQRSINNIVDLTNYIMLECGQPLHAFDADKVKGTIHIRKAIEGEEIVILGGTSIKLPSTTLVVSDDEGSLAIAGVKGGQRAEIDANTKNIILESACFDRSSVRKTSQQVGIRNESSKRFENGVTPERAGLGMAMFTSLLSVMSATNTDKIAIGMVTDIYENPALPKSFSVSISKINQRLGLNISTDKIQKILESIDMSSSIDESDADNLNIVVPEYRSDILIDEDIAEEVGRIYGYDKIEGVVEEKGTTVLENKNFYYHNILRKILVEDGFSEIYTYTLTDNGDVQIQNPLTIERGYMRKNISDQFSKKFLPNIKNADLIGTYQSGVALRPQVKIFEIGKIFDESCNERYALAFGVASGKGKNKLDEVDIEKVVNKIVDSLNVDNPANKISRDDFYKNSISFMKNIEGDAQTVFSGLVIEFDLDKIIDILAQPVKNIEVNDIYNIPKNKFQKISPYPFSVRDIAVFLPGEKGQESQIEDAISTALNSVGKSELLVKKSLFDIFTKNKEGEPIKTSYAYRLVFQSQEKTLSEEEINECMKAVTDECIKRGFEVR